MSGGDVIIRNLPFLMSSLGTTAELTFLALAGGYLLGTPLAVARSSKNKVAQFGAALVIETLRAAPALMILFWCFFLLPIALGRPVGAYTAAVVALVLFNTSYSAEIIRAGINAVDKGQMEAALSTGLSWLQALRYVVLPQAFASMSPAMMNQTVMVYKTTSIVYIIGVIDFFGAADIVNNREFRPIEIFLFIGLVYFIPSTLVSHMSKFLAQRRRLRTGLA